MGTNIKIDVVLLRQCWLCVLWPREWWKNELIIGHNQNKEETSSMPIRRKISVWHVNEIIEYIIRCKVNCKTHIKILCIQDFYSVFFNSAIRKTKFLFLNQNRSSKKNLSIMVMICDHSCNTISASISAQNRFFSFFFFFFSANFVNVRF